MVGVHAVEKNDGIAKITVGKVPHEAGVAYRIFATLADRGVDVDLILQTELRGQFCDIVFTVKKTDSERAKSLLQDLFKDNPETYTSVEDRIVKITVSGDGMQGRPGVAAEVFRCLYDSGVHILGISTSEIRISLLVAENEAETAFRTITESFEIEI